MAELNRLDREHLKKQIAEGSPVEMEFPVLNASIQETIHFMVDEILSKYSRPDLKECVYSSLKELVINGIKANIKHVVFVEEKIDPNDEASLQRGLSLVKNLLHENDLVDLQHKAIQYNLKITLSIIHSSERLLLIIENNTMITELEEQRMREKFGAALKYESIADYYMNNMDDSEGQGLGITMIVLMLKGHNIDPHAFTLDLKSNNSTRAKIEFPMQSEDIARNGG
jgi:hypothetical protein